MRQTRLVKGSNDDTEINLTPMLDVVFIMLIFFIVTATFVRDTGVPARTSESSDSSPEHTRVILVRIDADDEFWIDELDIDQAALRFHLVSLHTRNPEYPVVILPDPDSSADALVAAIDAARLADVADVAVAGAI